MTIRIKFLEQLSHYTRNHLPCIEPLGTIGRGASFKWQVGSFNAGGRDVSRPYNLTISHL